VLGVVVLGLGVPPGPVRGTGLVVADRSAGDLAAAHGDDRDGRPAGIRTVLPVTCAHE
jgi:hypothetical protein